MVQVRQIASGTPSRSGVAVAAAAVALVLGLAHAVVSFYWAAGGAGLLDTIGGQLESYGRRRTPIMIVSLWFIGLVKIIAALIPAAGVLWPIRTPRLRRAVRVLGWAEAVILIGYGGALSVAGWLVVSGILDLGPAADPRALRWHAFVWDPWFLVWGIAALIALAFSRKSGASARATGIVSRRDR